MARCEGGCSGNIYNCPEAVKWAKDHQGSVPRYCIQETYQAIDPNDSEARFFSEPNQPSRNSVVGYLITHS